MSVYQTGFSRLIFSMMLGALTWTVAGAQGPPGAARMAPATTRPATVPASGVEFVVLPSPRKATTMPASRIVYVIDATGTMLGRKFELLQRELTTAVGALEPTAAFTIVAFKGGNNEAEWVEPFARVLKPASEENKAAAFRFIERIQITGKGTNPMPALRLAFSQRADLIYFLTDGEFNNVVSYEHVVDEVRRLNKAKRTRLNTIAFLSEDVKGEEVLQRLAREHGGHFMKVAERDLQPATQPTTAPLGQ